MPSDARVCATILDDFVGCCKEPTRGTSMALQAMAAAAFDLRFPRAEDGRLDSRGRERPLDVLSNSRNSLFATYGCPSPKCGVFLKVLPEMPDSGFADADGIEPDAAIGALLNAYIDGRRGNGTPLQRFVPRYLGAFRCPAERTATSIALSHAAGTEGREDVHQFVAFERIDEPLALWDAVHHPGAFAAHRAVARADPPELAEVALVVSVGRFLRAMMEMARSMGFVHGDAHLGNVLLGSGPDAEWKVIDLGRASVGLDLSAEGFGQGFSEQVIANEVLKVVTPTDYLDPETNACGLPLDRQSWSEVLFVDLAPNEFRSWSPSGGGSGSWSWMADAAAIAFGALPALNRIPELPRMFGSYARFGEVLVLPPVDDVVPIAEQMLSFEGPGAMFAAGLAWMALYLHSLFVRADERTQPFPIYPNTLEVAVYPSGQVCIGTLNDKGVQRTLRELIARTGFRARVLDRTFGEPFFCNDWRRSSLEIAGVYLRNRPAIPKRQREKQQNQNQQLFEHPTQRVGTFTQMLQGLIDDPLDEDYGFRDPHGRLGFQSVGGHRLQPPIPGRMTSASTSKAVTGVPHPRTHARMALTHSRARAPSPAHSHARAALTHTGHTARRRPATATATATATAEPESARMDRGAIPVVSVSRPRPRHRPSTNPPASASASASKSPLWSILPPNTRSTWATNASAWKRVAYVKGALDLRARRARTSP